MGMSNEPTYITQKQGKQIEEHESRITRLERAVLIVVGYMIAEGSNVLFDVAALLS